MRIAGKEAGVEEPVVDEETLLRGQEGALAALAEGPEEDGLDLAPPQSVEGPGEGGKLGAGGDIDLAGAALGDERLDGTVDFCSHWDIPEYTIGLFPVWVILRWNHVHILWAVRIK